MLSYTAMQTQCQDLAQDTSAAALAFFKTNLNLGQRVLETEIGSFQTQKTATVSTVDGTDTYDLPADFLRLEKAYITISNTRYPIVLVHDEDEWQMYKWDTTSEQTVIQKIFVRRDTFEVYPTPSTSSYTITLIFEAAGKDMSAADYTTGVILTAVNADETIIGSGTTFVAAMADRYLKVTNDGIWYKIDSITSTTELELDKGYEGLAISGGNEAYIIGEMPRTPDGTHYIPVYFTMQQYYQGFKQNIRKARHYKELFELDMSQAKRTYKRRSTSSYIPPNRHRRKIPTNPNHYPTGLTT